MCIVLILSMLYFYHIGINILCFRHLCIYIYQHDSYEYFISKWRFVFHPGFRTLQSQHKPFVIDIICEATTFERKLLICIHIKTEAVTASLRKCNVIPSHPLRMFAVLRIRLSQSNRRWSPINQTLIQRIYCESLRHSTSYIIISTKKQHHYHLYTRPLSRLPRLLIIV